MTTTYSIHLLLSVASVRSSLTQLTFFLILLRVLTLFYNQPNLDIESGVHPYLHPNCHHKIMPTYCTNNRLNYISFNYDKILKVIQFLDPNKAHGHDGVSIKMLKLSWSFIIKLLVIIFHNCLSFWTFPNDWIKNNVVPIHKKK